MAGALRCPVSAVDVMTSVHREMDWRTDTNTNLSCPRVNKTLKSWGRLLGLDFGDLFGTSKFNSIKEQPRLIVNRDKPESCGLGGP